MEHLKQNFNLSRMAQVITDRLNDFDDNCDESEYGEDYRQCLVDTIVLLKGIERN